MRYKESISRQRFLLFAFISMAVVVMVVQSGHANLAEWRNILPRTVPDAISFGMLMGILANTLNWTRVYIVSLFRQEILSRTDYPYMCVSVVLAIASVAYFVLSEDGKLGDKLFFLIVFAVSAHNIRLYWLYFRKKRTAKNSDMDRWPL